MYTRAFSHGLVPPTHLQETIGEHLHRSVARFSDREALFVPHQNYHVNYGQLWDEVSLIARGLMACGISRGDKVGLSSECRYESVLLQYAVARIGAVLVSIEPCAQSDPEQQIVLSRISMLVIAKEHLDILRSDSRNGMAARFSDLRSVMILEEGWQELVAHSNEVDEKALRSRESGILLDDVSNIQIVCGVANVPEVVTHSHRSIIEMTYRAGRRSYPADDRICVEKSALYGFGMVLETLGCISFGACVVIP